MSVAAPLTNKELRKLALEKTRDELGANFLLDNRSQSKVRRVRHSWTMVVFGRWFSFLSRKEENRIKKLPGSVRRHLNKVIHGKAKPAVI